MATYAYLCPTPKQHCCGTLAKLSGHLEKQGIKKHGTQAEAFKCYTRYLVNILGCERISAREYRPKYGGPIQLLSKVSKFGSKLRTGKSGEGASAGANRGMGCVSTAGVIIST